MPSPGGIHADYSVSGTDGQRGYALGIEIEKRGPGAVCGRLFIGSVFLLRL
jgi:hypothetical protein